MSNGDVTTHGGGGSITTVGRFDIRAMGRHYLRLFKAAEPFRGTIDLIQRNQMATQCDSQGRLIALSRDWMRDERKRGWSVKAALAIRAAIEPQGTDPVYEAIWALEDAMEPPPEENIRAILGAMLSVLRTKPTEGAEFYVDALVGELTEPEHGDPFCAPAIAAAAKEVWTTKTFAPCIHEFMGPVRKHQERLDLVFAELNFIIEASQRAREVLKKLAPEKLPPPNARPPLTDEEVDDIFGPE